MKGQAYAGLGECFSVHDIVITQAQGVVHQQANEHLSSSDIAIVRARRMLDEAVDEVLAGRDPRGVVREPAQNDFRDMVVVTGEMGVSESKERYCAAYAADASLFAVQERT